MLNVDGLNQYYGGSHILRDVSFEAHVGEITVVLGRNGVGKTTLLKSLMGVVPVKTGSVRARRRRHHARDALRARAPRHRLRAAGARDLRPADASRTTCGWGWRRDAAARRSRRAVRAVPGAEADARPPRRRPVRRPAAAARDRARAGRRADAADARRADRRHPAEHHQGHRPRHPPAGRRARRRRWRSCSSSSTTTSPPSSPTGTS